MCDGVPNRAELQRDQIVEFVSAVRCRGEPEPSACRDLFDGVFERCRGYVMAFVDDHQSVAAAERLDIVTPGQGL
jgi:hypothetical protein